MIEFVSKGEQLRRLLVGEQGELAAKLYLLAGEFDAADAIPSTVTPNEPRHSESRRLFQLEHLRKLVSDTAHYPDSTSIMNQIVATDGKVWNVCTDITPLGVGKIIVLTSYHPELITLPS